MTGALLLLLAACDEAAPPTPAACAAGEACTTAAGLPGARQCVEGVETCEVDRSGTPSDADWLATELLTRPEADGATLSLVPAIDVEAFVELTAPGGAVTETGLAQAQAGDPLVIPLGGMPEDAEVRWRVLYRPTGDGPFAARAPQRLHTRRRPGASFTFTVQADSHLDDRSSVDLYHQTLAHAAASTPDFHIDLGDTFMCEKHSAPLTGEVLPAGSLDVVLARYLGEREHFGRIGAPLMLVNGNHEGETGFLLDGTTDNLAVWATLARKRYYPSPEPGGIYTTSAADDPLVGARQQPYAWAWGDALFIVLDPFWYTTTKARPTDRWAWTLGDAQYAWLRDTLLTSDARYKFVFAHHIVGGGDPASRGGVEQAPYFEWGGRELDGTDTFAEHRPGWEMPIHELFVAAGVTAFFHGHDHVYVHQELDGVAYQEVPQPSALNYRNGATLAEEGGYTTGTVLGSSGHLRVTVTPTEATVAYVRSYLPEDQGAGRVDGAIEDTYTLAPR